MGSSDPRDNQADVGDGTAPPKGPCRKSQEGAFASRGVKAVTLSRPRLIALLNHQLLELGRTIAGLLVTWAWLGPGACKPPHIGVSCL